VFTNLFSFFKKVKKRLFYIFFLNRKNKLFRKLSYHSVNQNPSFLRITSTPYISGDTFRAYADHIFDETRSINPKKIKKGDTIFLKTELKEIFFSEFHIKIPNKYILISHNSDTCINKNDLNFIDQKIIHWFAMKLNVAMNKKISPLPSGLENYRYLNNGIVRNFNKAYKVNNNIEKSNRILCSFNVSTNKSEREPLMEIAKVSENIDIKNFSDNSEYLNNLSNYRYNLCPEGNNFESHRIWETLFFNNYPVVKNNSVNLNFVNLGVPLIMLNSWESLKTENIYQTLNKNIPISESDPRQFVYFEFWKHLIESKKNFI
tara:strand:- start:80 stop:1033 length:954 start_codon:yes stop_codon:yes gene_type:complete